jgi:iron(III) transport system substrate-binding protein
VAALGFAGFTSAASAADQAMIDAARKEGEVVWYTTQIIDPLVLKLADAFKAKYGVTLNYVRSNSTEIALRIINEGKAGKIGVDVYDGTTTAEVLKAGKLALQWLPDAAKTFARDYVDPEGYWVATNYYIITAAYNTDLVKPGAEPTTWDALLDPRFKGQIVWGNTVSISAAPGFVGLVLKQLGEEKGMDYLRKLAAQKPAGVNAAARVVIDQAIAGEYAIALQIFPEHADQSSRKGAPIKWIATRPAMSAIVSTMGVVANSPHPNAGKLLLDFLVSPEGQAIYRDAFYSPANPAVEPINPDFKPGRYPTLFISPPEATNLLPKWTTIFKELF